jgi:hypothetical protein
MHAMMMAAHRNRIRNAECQDLVDEQQDRQSFKIENEVLIDLWKELGDQTETYWQAMGAITVFSNAVVKIQEDVKGLKAPIAVMVSRALGRTFLAQSEAIAETDRALEELHRKHKLEDES